MDSTSRNFSLSAIVSGVVSLIVVFLFSMYWSRGTAPVPDSTSAYSQIRSSGIIRAAYNVSAPLFVIDPNTKQKSGLFYDIINSAAAKLGLKADWVEEVGYGQMIEGINAHRYDIVGSGIWINAGRGKDADFTIPLYYDAVLAYVKDNDNRFSANLSELNSPNFTISTMDGELGETIAKTDFPRAKTAALPQSVDFTQLILNVVNGKADVVFLSLAVARQYQEANPHQIKAANSDKPVRVFPVAILLPKGAYDLKQSLDYAVSEMLNAGEVDGLLEKYEKVPGSFLRVASPYSAAGQSQ